MNRRFRILPVVLGACLLVQVGAGLAQEATPTPATLSVTPATSFTAEDEARAVAAMEALRWEAGRGFEAMAAFIATTDYPAGPWRDFYERYHATRPFSYILRSNQRWQRGHSNGSTTSEKALIQQVALHAVATNRLGRLFADHPEDLGPYLESLAPEEREDRIAWNLLLSDIATDPAPGFDVRARVANWVSGLVATSPRWMRPDRGLDPVGQPWVAGFRTQLQFTILNAVTRLGGTRTEIADVLGLTGERRGLLVDRGQWMVDVGYYTERDLRALRSYLDVLPPHLIVTDSVWLSALFSRHVPIEGVGRSHSAAAVHVGGGVDTYWSTDDFPLRPDLTLSTYVGESYHAWREWMTATGFDARRDALRGAAGHDPANYLHSRRIAEGETAYEDWPDGLFYDLNRVCMNHTANAFESAKRRLLLQGRGLPLAQLLWWLDVWSGLGSAAKGFVIDGAGRLTHYEIPLTRDGSNRIRTLGIGGETWQIGYAGEHVPDSLVRIAPVDGTSPGLVSAGALRGGTRVGLVFDEALDPTSARNPANYRVNGAVPSSATPSEDMKRVTLGVAALAGDAVAVSVAGVKDLAGNARTTPAETSFTAIWTAVDLGPAENMQPPSSSMPWAADVVEIVAGGRSFHPTDDYHFVHRPVSGDFDARVRVSQFETTEHSAGAGLMFRASTDPSSRFVKVFAHPLEGARVFVTHRRVPPDDLGDAPGGVHHSVAGASSIWLRLVREGDRFTSLISTNGSEWKVNATWDQPLPANGLLGPSVTARNDGRATTARVEFRDFLLAPAEPLVWLESLRPLVGDEPVAQVSHEAGGRLGLGRVRRSRVASTPMTVRLRWTGAAVRGADFEAPTEVTIPAGYVDAPVEVRALNDAEVEGTERFSAVAEVDAPAQAVGVPLPFVVIDDERPAGLTRSLYLYSGTGAGLGDLRSSPWFPLQPDATDLVADFETFLEPHQSHGTRLSGYLVPPETGEYRFFLASDWQSELRLSTDDSTANLRRIAEEPQWSNPRVWAPRLNGEKASAPIRLEAGRRYALEVLHGRGGGDHVAVAWQRPGGDQPMDGSAPIPGEYLEPRLEDLNLPGIPRLWVRWAASEGGNDHWYAVRTGSQRWTDAAGAARALPGMELASIRSLAEQAFLTRVFGNSNYWIGLTDAGSEARFRWTSGEAVEFTHWLGGEPNNCCIGEHFVHSWAGGRGAWNDWPDLAGGPANSLYHIDGALLEIGSGPPMDAGRVKVFGGPISRRAVVGTPVRLESGIEGAADEVQWFRDGEVLAGATGSSLELPSAGVADAGLYRVRVRVGGESALASETRLLVAEPGGLVHAGKLAVDPLGNMEGDGSRGFLDLTSIGLQISSNRYHLSAEVAAPFPTPGEMGTRRRLDIIWTVDGDRDLATGQSIGAGNDYNIHAYLDGNGWHPSWYKVSPYSASDGVTVREEDFRIVAEGNRVVLSFPKHYLPRPDFEVWTVAGSFNSPDWPPVTVNPATGRALFDLRWADGEGPVVLGAEGYVGDTKLTVRFGETVNPASAMAVANYRVGGNPPTGAVLGEDRRSVRLTVPGLEAGTIELSVSGVADLAGNVMTGPVTVSVFPRSSFTAEDEARAVAAMEALRWEAGRGFEAMAAFIATTDYPAGPWRDFYERYHATRPFSYILRSNQRWHGGHSNGSTTPEKALIQQVALHAVATNRLGRLFADHPEDLGPYLESLAPEAREDLIAWNLLLIDIGKDPAPGFDARVRVANWVADQVVRHPQWLRPDRELDPVGQPWVAGFRTQLQFTILYAVTRLGGTRTEIADVLGLTGERRGLFVDRGQWMVDVGYYTERDLRALRSYLDVLPPHLIVTDSVWLSALFSRHVPIEGVGRSHSAAAVHVGGGVDTYWSTDDFPLSPDLTLSTYVGESYHAWREWMTAAGFDARRDALRGVAGHDPANYLHSRRIAEGETAYEDWPDGLFYDLNRVCVNHAANAFESAKRRLLLHGRGLPLAQLLWWLDVWSGLGSAAKGFVIDGAGTLTHYDIPLTRDGLNRIRTLVIGGETWQIGYAGDLVPDSLVRIAPVDGTPPGLVSAGALRGGTRVELVFDEALDPTSARNPANYRVNGAVPSSATPSEDMKRVTLGVAALAGDAVAVSVAGVKDLAGNARTTPAEISFTAIWTAVDLGPSEEMTPASRSMVLDTDAVGIEAGGWSHHPNDDFHFVFRSVSGDFDARVQVVDFASSEYGADTGLMFRGTSGPTSAYVHVLMTNPKGEASFKVHVKVPPSGVQQAPGLIQRSVPPSGPYWLRLQREGNRFTGFVSYDGTAWLPCASWEQSMPTDGLLGFASSALNAGRSASVRSEFRHLVVGLPVPRVSFAMEPPTAVGQTDPATLLESGGRVGRARIVRGAAGSGPLTVRLAWSGSATLGVDFEAPTEVTIPAEAVDAPLEVRVLDDGLSEGREEATVRLVLDPPGEVSGEGRTFVLLDDENPTGGLVRTVYQYNSPDGSLAHLLARPNFPHDPDASDVLPSFASGALPYGHGTRIRGFVLPPETGDYRFFLAASGQAELRLSTDEDPANLRLIASEPSSSGSRDWTVRSNGEKGSGLIRLEAGRRYFVEVLQQKGAADLAEVAWQRPGQAAPVNGDPPIPGEHLAFRVEDLPRYLVPNVWVQWPSAIGGNDHWYTVQTKRLHWTEAEASATTQPGVNLVSIRSREEQDFLRDVFGTSGFWIGLTDYGSEGRFRWTSGEPADFLFWSAGEPNNCCAGEHFVQTDWLYLGMWNDRDPEFLLASLLERETPPADVPETLRVVRPPQRQVVTRGATARFEAVVEGGPAEFQWYHDGQRLEGATRAALEVPSASLADAGYYQLRVGIAGREFALAPVHLTVQSPPEIWVRWPSEAWGNDHWYGRVPGPQTWWDAENFARTQAACYQVSVRSAGERDFLWATFGKFEHWLGLSDVVTEGVWAWSSGEPLDYTDWAPGEPNNFGGEDFGHTWGLVGYRWNDHSIVTMSGGSMLERNSRPPPGTAATLVASGPASRVVAVGFRAVLELPLEGPVPMLQWLHRGVAIPGATERTYTIPQATVADAGEYQVRMGEAPNTVLSMPGRLYVVAPPDRIHGGAWIGDPVGNLTGDTGRAFLDLLSVSVSATLDRYHLEAQTLAPFPPEGDMAGGRSVTVIWFVDADRNRATGQSAEGNDYNIHLDRDAAGWHASWYKVSDFAASDGIAIRMEDFHVEVDGNRVSLSFPRSYLPRSAFDLYAVCWSNEAWAPPTANAYTGRATFDSGALPALLPPVAAPDTLLRASGLGTKARAMRLSANDLDPLGGPATVVAVAHPSAQGGTVTLRDGWVYYEPPAGDPATDTFEYTVAGATGLTGVGTVAVTRNAPGAASRFNLVGMTGGGAEPVTLRISGIPGRRYVVQWTPSLAEPNWTTLGEATELGAGLFEYVDAGPVGQPARFYRAVEP